MSEKIDFISRDEAIDNLCESCFMRNCSHDCDAIKAIRETKPADVRTVAEISDAVDEAIDFLNSVSNQMPYHVYSALFDLICGVLTDHKENEGDNKNG